MTFDVGLLPGRAQELKKAGAHAAYREMTRYGGGGAEMLKAAEGYMEGVENVYASFLNMPSPEDFVPWISSLQKAMGKVATEGHTSDPVTGSTAVSGHNPNLAKVASTGDQFAGWTGDAADSYNLNYADQFVGTASSQYAAVSVLRNALNAEAAVWASTRDDLDKLSSQAITYMNDAGSKGGAEWVAVLSIAAAVVSIPVTGGVSAAAIPAVAAGLSIAATGISAAAGGDPPDSLGLDAGSSEKVIASLEDALAKLKSRIVEQEAKIRTAMSQSCTVLDEDWKVFSLPSPAICDASQHGVNDNTMAGYDA